MASRRTVMQTRDRGPGPQEQTRTIQRITSGALSGSADRLARLDAALIGRTASIGSSLINFVEQGQEREREEARKVKEREDELLGREAIRVALDDPDGVDVALSSGDPKILAGLSTLQGIDANRPEFLDSLKLAHGRNRAIIDYNDALSTSIRELPYDSGADPRKLRDDFADQQMEGADPTLDFAYRKTLAEISETDIARWGGQQREFMAHKQVEKEIQSFTATVMGGTPVGPEDVEGLIGRVVGMATTPEGKIKARDRAIYEVFDLANKTGSTSLLAALTRPDPQNNGLSMADIHRGLWDQALSSNLESFRSVKSMAAQEDLSRLELLATSVGEGLSDVDSGKLLSEVQNHLSTHGYSAQWEGLMKRTMGIVGKQVEFEAAYSTMASSLALAGSSPHAGAPYVPAADLNKYGPKFAEDYVKRRLADGVPQSQVQGELAKIVADYGGLGTQWNARITHDLLSGDPATASATYHFLSSVDKSRGEPGAVAAILTDPVAKSKYDFVSTVVEQFGMNPDQAMAGFDNAAKTQGGDTNWRGFARKVLPEGDLDDWVEEIADDIEDTTGAPMSLTATRVIEEELSRQLWLHGDTVSKDKTEAYKAAVAKTVADQLEVTYDDANDTLVATLRKTPRVVMYSDGTVGVAAPITEQTHTDAIAAYAEDVVPIFGTAFGPKAVGIQPTDEAAKGYGAVVVVENEVGERAPLILPYGATIEMTPSGELPAGVTAVEGGVRLENTGAPMRMGRFTVAPHPGMPGWAALYYTGEDISPTQRDAMHKEELLRRASEPPKPEPSALQQGVNSVLAPVTEGFKAQQKIKGFFGNLFDRTSKTIDKEVGSHTLDSPTGRALTGGVAPGIGLANKAINALKGWVAAPSVPNAEAAGRGEKPDTGNWWQEKFRSWIHNMAADGSISGDTANRLLPAVVRSQEDFERYSTQAFQEASLRGNSLRPAGQTGFTFAAIQHVSDAEGLSLASYQDGKTRSVGFGFNLKRPDARELIGQMGLDYDKVWSGEQRLTRKQATQLLNYEVGRLNTVIRQKFKGVPLLEHQRLALLDIAYNRGQGVLDQLSDAVKTGTAWEVAQRIMSLPVGSHHTARTKDVLRNRYAQAAAMYMGGAASWREGGIQQARASEIVGRDPKQQATLDLIETEAMDNGNPAFKAVRDILSRALPALPPEKGEALLKVITDNLQTLSEKPDGLWATDLLREKLNKLDPKLAYSLFDLDTRPRGEVSPQDGRFMRYSPNYWLSSLFEQEV